MMPGEGATSPALTAWLASLDQGSLDDNDDEALQHGQRTREISMGWIRKKSEPPKKEDDKPKKPPPSQAQDDDREDGDIATPKRDRYGNDDEPL